MPWSSKFFVIVAIVALTFGYAQFQYNIIREGSGSAQGLILQQLPEFAFKDVTSSKDLTGKDLLPPGSKGAFVHFWGTWCAPCEAEMPSFVEYARKFEDEGVRFLILAVNDELPKVKKFLRRFSKNTPKNVIFGFDKDGISLDLFGTVKVPETYLFNAAAKHLNKFIGPQEWDKTFYKDKADRHLLDTSEPPVFKKVETH